MITENNPQLAAFIWSVVDLLRGDFKQSQYGRIIMPFTPANSRHAWAPGTALGAVARNVW